MWAREGRKVGMRQKCGWNVGGALPLHLLLLWLLLPGLACAMLDVCLLEENTKVSLAQEEKNLIHLRENHGSMTVISKGCDVNHTFDLDKKLLKVDEGMTDIEGREWIVMRYYIKANLFDIYFAGKSMYRVSHPVDGACVSAHKRYFEFKNISLGYDCTDHKSDNSQRIRRPRLIWIPIGSLFLLVAMCCRCIRNKRNGQPMLDKWWRRNNNNDSRQNVLVVVTQATTPVPPPYLPSSATTPAPPPPYTPLSATTPVPPPYTPLSATTPVSPPYLPPSDTNPMPPPYLPPSATDPVPLQSNPTPSHLPPSATDPKDSTNPKPTFFSKVRNQFGFTRLQEDKPTN